MNSKITLSCFAIFLILFSHAQSPDSELGGGEFIFNPEKKPCITPEQRITMLQDVQVSIEELQRENKLSFSEQRRGNHPLFAWPLQKASGLNYNEIYGISGYVDHNTGFPNQLTDYNCGTRTYDSSSGYNHQGIDMFTWPFGWKMMDNDEVEIIASAPGQIVFKRDGEFDRSCNLNNNVWNTIYVQHSDGSVILYGHMKNGSVTSKNVGDMVSTGEYLGIVGSSGNSTGPHLHFEVFEGIVNNILTGLVDPFFGNCNNMNVDSWWQSQRPYNNPGINAVLTHTADPVFPACPTTETTNESNQFDINQEVFFTIFLKDQVAGTSVNLRIIKPDNTDLFNWTHDLTNNFSASWWRWTAFPDVAGEWKWEATYAGETITHTFNVDDPLSISEEDFNQTSIFPNPFNDIIHISSTKRIVRTHIVDILGKTILTIKDTSNGISEIDVSNFSNGMYFVRLESDANEIKIIKLIKE